MTFSPTLTHLHYARIDPPSVLSRLFLWGTLLTAHDPKNIDVIQVIKTGREFISISSSTLYCIPCSDNFRAIIFMRDRPAREKGQREVPSI